MSIEETRRQIRDARQEFVDATGVQREYLVIMQRTTAYARYLGLPPNVMEQINLMERAIRLGGELQRTYIMLQAAQAGAGPIGWIMLGLSVASVAITASQFLMESS